jgi:hypothetical protein
MRIADLPESTTYDESCYMPVDVAGATYKTKVDNVTPNVANNVQTTAEGYVWAARQGKLLKDRIDKNTQGIAETNGTVTQGVVVKNDPWTLYQSRDNNTDVLYYPRTAKEILITVELPSYYNFVMNAVYVPGVFAFLTGNIMIHMGGWYYGNGEYLKIRINYVTRSIGSVEGSRSDNSIRTKVYYR